MLEGNNYYTKILPIKNINEIILEDKDKSYKINVKDPYKYSYHAEIGYRYYEENLKQSFTYNTEFSSILPSRTVSKCDALKEKLEGKGYEVILTRETNDVNISNKDIIKDESISKNNSVLNNS